MEKKILLKFLIMLIKHKIKLIIPRIKWRMKYLKQRKQFAKNKNLFDELHKLHQDTKEWYNQSYRTDPDSKTTTKYAGQLDILNKILYGR